MKIILKSKDIELGYGTKYISDEVSGDKVIITYTKEQPTGMAIGQEYIPDIVTKTVLVPVNEYLTCID